MVKLKTEKERKDEKTINEEFKELESEPNGISPRLIISTEERLSASDPGFISLGSGKYRRMMKPIGDS